MKADKLREIFKYVLFVNFSDYMLTDKLELYCFKTDKSIHFKSIEETLSYNITAKSTISDELDKIDFIWNYSGGRGANSNKMGGGFNSAGEGRGRGGQTISLYPAEFNSQGRFTSQEKAIQMFENKYGNANREYGISVDTQGFVHRHVQGGAHSVAISAHGKDHMVVHNHPSGGAFSKADLLATVSDKIASGIIATGTQNGVKQRYTFVKGKDFKGSDFVKAVNKAKWPVKMSYDEGARWWLSKNATKYGYSFSYTN